MRDPLTWSFPLGRLFGINIRIHILFVIFALAMVARAATVKDPPAPQPAYPAGLWLDALILVGLAFLAVLLHELGHCLSARMVDGDAPEILLWPLGGLAPLDLPHTPRANFIAAAAGPAVNLLLCVSMGLLLGAYSLRPSLNPWSQDAVNPTALRLFKWSEGIAYGHSPVNPGDPTQFVLVVTDKDGKVEEKPVTDRSKIEEKPVPREPGKEPPKEKEYVYKDDPKAKVAAKEPATLERWQVWAARFFWVNWMLFLLNLLPALPLDGGRLLQSFLWWRGEFRQATIYAVFAGFAAMVLMVFYSMVIDSVLPLLLSWIVYMTCNRQWYVLETGGEEPMFGYDFSQGYTSLERGEGEPRAPRQKKPNFIQRWLQRRAQRKLQREQEEREAEERRLDELLDKVKQVGMQALTDEERRFLNRVSSRYKNRH
jgi:Zn-dependent protease